MASKVWSFEFCKYSKKTNTFVSPEVFERMIGCVFMKYESLFLLLFVFCLFFLKHIMSPASELICYNFNYDLRFVLFCPVLSKYHT